MKIVDCSRQCEDPPFAKAFRLSGIDFLRSEAAGTKGTAVLRRCNAELENVFPDTDSGDNSFWIATSSCDASFGCA